MIMRKYKHLGKTVVLVTHEIFTVQKYCDDDGEQHVVDYSVTGGVRVDWASPGRETELYVVHGAEIIDNHTGYGICVYENGIVSISGGFISQNVHSSEEG